MLTLDILKQTLRYDPETGLWIWLKQSMKGSNRIPGVEAGHIDKTTGYVRVTIFGRKYKSARLAYFYMTGSWPTHLMDHKDGDPRNNRWNNLRPSTPSQNSVNRRKWRGKKFKGVDCHDGRWRARLRVNGQLLDLGYFSSAYEAAMAYDAEAIRQYGSFAKTNTSGGLNVRTSTAD